ncbi:MAG: tRNA pseudouridine(55) synthase TruB [Chloroflexi bacterium]|nr:tRNA pseudouridine(55) synthase TruB [Chloroflexota bacterium]
MTHEFNGYLNVFKAPGETSHGVVSRIRRLTGQKRVGHAGTLDPAAVGVLPLAVGGATRFAMSPGWSQKAYWADVTFGMGTDTDDAQGRVTILGDPSAIDLPMIEDALPHFFGEIAQRPPAYSAVRLGGTRSYALARRGKARLAGERRVRVDDLKVVSWAPPVLSVRVECGSGTYVRSLARDLGEHLGCPAYLSALVRLQVGLFRIEDALTYDQLDQVAAAGAWEQVVWPVDLPLLGCDAVVVSPERERDFLHGRGWEASVTTPGAVQVRVYSRQGEMLGAADRNGARLQPTVVLGGRG